MSPSPTRTATSPRAPSAAPTLRVPTVTDGAAIHQIAERSRVLDVNSGYAYVLWCHDFADTSVVAEIEGTPVGFVTGYRRPDDPATLMVWQVATGESYRGLGIAAAMLHHLLDRTAAQGVSRLQTTISPDNPASQRLFAAVAAQRGLRFSRRDLFAADLFPDSHQPEDLYTLEPDGFDSTTDATS
ncbi:diaminobutyrate acetyltransferase [Gordonia desulfuricans]|uniref:L-2,4-diaminobutyric acid acetyltransferase n=1 Tax=Gordonia desulfuricans TaxID=89051 RepID=A0A7K3LTR3_9ACTN|nr:MULTISPECIES: diaminobutyrate acetyltransferase [Gordonia]EMP13807.1 2,4-diaminobutyric acid acetyltransferase [Gordonia sp. NB41Y]NDK91665.1 diaminobutyrate acetyltransferase [Gordonia desulfuricans]WLP91227.1 diaminobutyrate acetyltransferase [Gordonia sp. NB41Y]